MSNNNQNQIKISNVENKGKSTFVSTKNGNMYSIPVSQGVGENSNGKNLTVLKDPNGNVGAVIINKTVFPASEVNETNTEFNSESNLVYPPELELKLHKFLNSLEKMNKNLNQQKPENQKYNEDAMMNFFLKKQEEIQEFSKLGASKNNIVELEKILMNYAKKANSLITKNNNKNNNKNNRSQGTGRYNNNKST
jgi:hypothetical protein